MMRLFAAYLVVGGMPEVVQRYVDTHDIAQMLGLQRDITALYRQDIAKYATGGDKAKIRTSSTPSPPSSTTRTVASCWPTSRRTARQNRYESSFLWLAMQAWPCPATTSTPPTTPLAANAKHSLFKLFMAMSGFSAQALWETSNSTSSRETSRSTWEASWRTRRARACRPRLQPALLQQQTAGRSGFRCAAGQEGDPIEVKSGNDWHDIAPSPTSST